MIVYYDNDTVVYYIILECNLLQCTSRPARVPIFPVACGKDYMCIYIYIHTYMYIYIYICYVRICIIKYIYIYIERERCIYIYIYTYTHVYIYIYTHTYICMAIGTPCLGIAPDAIPVYPSMYGFCCHLNKLCVRDSQDIRISQLHGLHFTSNM